MKPIKRSNSESSELTYEKLKSYKGFENITEAQAEKEIKFIKGLAKVLQLLFVYEQQNEKQKLNDYEN